MLCRQADARVEFNTQIPLLADPGPILWTSYFPIIAFGRENTKAPKPSGKNKSKDKVYRFDPKIELYFITYFVKELYLNLYKSQLLAEIMKLMFHINEIYIVTYSV